MRFDPIKFGRDLAQAVEAVVRDGRIVLDSRDRPVRRRPYDSFELIAVELDEMAPGIDLVITFRAEQVPGKAFGVRWPDLVTMYRDETALLADGFDEREFLLATANAVVADIEELVESGDRPLPFDGDERTVNWLN